MDYTCDHSPSPHRSIRSRFWLALVTLALMSSSAQAEYEAQGGLRGFFCTTWLFFDTCKFHPVDAVADQNGRLFTPATLYPDVSEYKPPTATSPAKCWIQLKADPARLGWFATLYNNFAGLPEFYSLKPGGDPAKLDNYDKRGTPDFIVFNCIKH
jgi:hypothetical protein